MIYLINTKTSVNLFLTVLDNYTVETNIENYTKFNLGHISIAIMICILLIKYNIVKTNPNKYTNGFTSINSLVPIIIYKLDLLKDYNLVTDLEKITHTIIDHHLFNILTSYILNNKEVNIINFNNIYKKITIPSYYDTDNLHYIINVLNVYGYKDEKITENITFTDNNGKVEISDDMIKEFTPKKFRYK